MLRTLLFRPKSAFLNPKYSQSFIFPLQQHRSITVKVPKVPKTAAPTLPNLEVKDHTTAKGKLKRRLFERFFDYLSGYEAVLKKVLPASAVRIFELFSRGTKSLFADMKEFAGTNHVLTATTNWEKACKTLTRHQLELYLNLPSDLIRTSPVLLISALPFAQNVVFPVALMFPKLLLSSHFWSEQEWHEVNESWLRRRQRFYLTTLSHLIKLGQASQEVKDSEDWRRTFHVLEMGKSPTPEEILALKPLFETGPLQLKSLKAPYARYLLKVHGVSGFAWWWFPRYKLVQHGNILRQIDLAIVREDINSLSERDLRSACYTRGLNVHNVDKNDADAFLRQWTEVSLKTDARSISLLLHLPILLGMNRRDQFWEATSTTIANEHMH